MQYNYYIKSWF